MPHVHAHPPPQFVTRRRFIQGAAGAAALGAAFGSGVLRPQLAGATGPGIGEVLPISGGSPLIEGFFDQLFHVYAPAVLDSADSDPSSVGNFSGDVGIAFIDGTVRETNRRTGAARELPFNDADMRFMQGVFRGRGGQVREGTFAFI
jgi:hypothetical protein